MKTDKLEKLNACRSAVEYLKTQPTYLKAWQNCERGDWMLWIAKELNVDDRKLTMARYHCAAQVIHLMKDQRSLDVMAASLKYANGEITREELNSYAAYAYAVAAFADAAAYAAAYAADCAAACAAYAAYVVADADAAAAYAAADAAVDAAARKDSLKKSADICRLYLTKEVLTKYKAFK